MGCAVLFVDYIIQLFTESPPNYRAVTFLPETGTLLQLRSVTLANPLAVKNEYTRFRYQSSQRVSFNYS
jgi:hypothetical protein